jgi:co-chaperonin GroES (HSP10)
MSNIIPLGDNIIVKPFEKKQILVSDNKSLCLYGEVIAVSQNADARAKSYIKIGDKVVYEMWGLKSPEIDGEKVHFISESSPFLLGKLCD